MTTSERRPFWIDAQLPPVLAARLRTLGHEAAHVFEHGAHTASDLSIFHAAREANAIVITKDVDFVQLLERFGQPPSIIWITIGNVGNAELWNILVDRWPRILRLLDEGESLIELNRGGPI